MATRTLDQTVGALNPQASGALRVLALRLRDGMRALGPYGRRYILTGIGAVCALGLGVAAALTVQLPPEMKDPIQAQEQTLVQAELPSEAQALSNALNNPPAFAAPDDHGADVAIAPDASPPNAAAETTTVDPDEKPTGPVSTAAAANDDAPAVAKSAPKGDEADGAATIG